MDISTFGVVEVVPRSNSTRNDDTFLLPVEEWISNGSLVSFIKPLRDMVDIILWTLYYQVWEILSVYTMYTKTKQRTPII